MSLFRFICTLILITSLTNMAYAGAPTILVVPKSEGLFWDYVRLGAEQAGADRGAKVIFRGPTSVTNLEAQLTILQDGIDAEVDAIVLAPSHTTQAIPVLERARQKGITIVLIDSDMDFKDRVSYVATDNLEAGKMAARYLRSLIKDNSTVLLLHRRQTNESTAKREKGVREVLEKDVSSQIKIRCLLVDGSVGSAYHTIWDLFQSTPEVDAIITLDEASSAGALRALRETGRSGSPVFICIDYLEDGRRALETGEVKGMVLQNPYLMGYKGIIAACDALEEQKIPKRMVTPTVLVTTPEELTNLENFGFAPLP